MLPNGTTLGKIKNARWFRSCRVYVSKQAIRNDVLGFMINKNSFFMKQFNRPILYTLPCLNSYNAEFQLFVQFTN